jgi:DNA-binding NtrC family response regulator
VAALRAARWPGNVRELRNVVRRAAILTRDEIGAAELELPPPAPFRFAEEAAPAAHAPAAARGLGADTVPLAGRTFDEIERDVLAWALRQHGGSRRRAARALAMARSTFCDKVKRYGIADGGERAKQGTAAT